MNILFCYHTTDYEYNLGIAALSAALEPLKVNICLVIFREIADKPKDTIESTVQKILEKKPEIVAFSIMTFNWPKIQKLINKLRESYSGLIVVGGCHAMLCPQEVLAFSGVDAVCTGEGEKPIQDLARLAQQYSPQSLPPIPGLWLKRDLVSTPAIPWCNEHLIDFPYLSYDVFDKERAQPFSQKITGHFSFAGLFVLPVITSRGCPYKCTYCNNHSFMELLGGPQSFLRTYPVKQIIPDIKVLVQSYRPEFIDFMDEMFLKGMSWMRDFCKAYTKNISLPFSINARIDKCTDEVSRMLADSGLQLVLFGLECGDEHYRKNFLNRAMTNLDILRGAETLRKHDIAIVTYNMFGMPNETPQLLEKTINLNRKIRPDAVAAFVYQPLPQTILGRLAVESGLAQPPPEDHWDYLAPALDSEILPAKYVQEQVELFRQEFNSPERIQAVANKIRYSAGKGAL